MQETWLGYSKISRTENYPAGFVVNATFINIVRRYLVLINVDGHANNPAHFFLNVLASLD